MRAVDRNSIDVALEGPRLNATLVFNTRTPRNTPQQILARAEGVLLFLMIWVEQWAQIISRELPTQLFIL